jgi:hypothetical protein
VLTWKVVYLGDTVTNTFTLDGSTGTWNDEWVVAPGEQGEAAGQGPFSGSLTFDPTIASKFCITFENQKKTILTQ